MAQSSIAQLSSQTNKASQTQVATRSASDRKVIAENFDTFLTLLTTQLQNQSPLDPLDTNEFTQQLVQFSSVEQEIRMNEQMEQLLTIAAANANTAVVGYLGQTITAQGAATQFDGSNSMNWSYKALADAPQTKITVRDADGNIVHEETKALSNGKGNYTWDGYTKNGSRVPAGSYQITLDARNSDGGGVQVKTEVTGTVTGIDLSGDEPVLEVGSVRLPISQVKSIATQPNN